MVSAIMRYLRINLLVVLLSAMLCGAGLGPALAQSGDSLKDLKRQADDATRSNNYEQAATLWEQASKLAPSDPSVHSSLGKVYYELDRYEDCIKEIELSKQLRDGAPWQSDSPCMCGFAYHQLKQSEKAVQWLKTCLEVAKNPIQLA